MPARRWLHGVTPSVRVIGSGLPAWSINSCPPMVCPVPRLEVAALSWCCGDACPGTYPECQVICTFRTESVKPRSEPTHLFKHFETIRLLTVAANGRKVVRAAATASSRSRPSLLVAREFRHSFWGNALKDMNAQAEYPPSKKGLGKMGTKLQVSTKFAIRLNGLGMKPRRE